jgi:hypothetical protein
MKFEIKNFKAVRGHDGQGFQCSLYVDGARAAYVFDDGWGGDYQFSEENPRLMKLYDQHVLAQPQYDIGHGFGPTDHNRDTILGGLIDKHEAKKQLKKWCKNETLFRITGDEEGSWRTIGYPFCQKVKDLLVKKYGAGDIEIANESL